MTSPQELELEAIKSELKSKFGFDIPEFNPPSPRPGSIPAEYKVAEYSSKEGYLRLDRFSRGTVNGRVEYILLEDEEGQKVVGKREWGKVSFRKEGGEVVTYDTTSVKLGKEGAVENGGISVSVDVMDSRVESPVNLAMATYGNFPDEGLAGEWYSLEIKAGEKSELINDQIEEQEELKNTPVSMVSGGAAHAAGQRVLHSTDPMFARSEEDPKQVGFQRGLFGPLRVLSNGERVTDEDLKPYEYQLDEGPNTTEVKRFNTEQGTTTTYALPTKIDFQQLYKKSIGPTAEWTSIRLDHPISITSITSITPTT